MQHGEFTQISQSLACASGGEACVSAERMASNDPGSAWSTGGMGHSLLRILAPLTQACLQNKSVAAPSHLVNQSVLHKNRTATWKSNGPTFWMSCQCQRYSVSVPRTADRGRALCFGSLTFPLPPSTDLLLPPSPLNSTLNTTLDTTSTSRITFFYDNLCAKIAFCFPRFVHTTTSPCSGCQFGAQTEP